MTARGKYLSYALLVGGSLALFVPLAIVQMRSGDADRERKLVEASNQEPVDSAWASSANASPHNDPSNSLGDDPATDAADDSANDTDDDLGERLSNDESKSPADGQVSELSVEQVVDSTVAHDDSATGPDPWSTEQDASDTGSAPVSPDLSQERIDELENEIKESGSFVASGGAEELDALAPALDFADPVDDAGLGASDSVVEASASVELPERPVVFRQLPEVDSLGDYLLGNPLNGILVTNTDAAVLLGGRILRVGEELPDALGMVTAIERQFATISSGERHVRVDLPPLSLRGGAGDEASASEVVLSGEPEPGPGAEGPDPEGPDLLHSEGAEHEP